MTTAPATFHSPLQRRVPLCAALAGTLLVLLLAILISADGFIGWDARVYWQTAQTAARGGDPYAEGIASQQSFHNRAFPCKRERPPLTFVYSPASLPLIKPLALLSGHSYTALYSLAALAGLLLQLWAGYQMASPAERRVLLPLLPWVTFFPGLLAHNAVLAGNLSTVFLGPVMAAAVLGWRKNRWWPFYALVFVMGFFKTLLLTLLAIPVLLGRRQWIPAASLGALSLGAYFGSALLWPSYFHEYLQAVHLQFAWNYDLGFGPSGLAAAALLDEHLPFEFLSSLVYILFAAAVSAVLLYLDRRVRRGEFSFSLWLPLVWLGVCLLNPRIKEYDIQSATIPMILLATRALTLLFRGRPDPALPLDSPLCPTPRTIPNTLAKSPAFAVLATSGIILILFNYWSGTDWPDAEFAMMSLCFLLGIWSLFAERASRQRALATVESAEPAELLTAR